MPVFDIGGAASIIITTGDKGGGKEKEYECVKDAYPA